MSRGTGESANAALVTLMHSQEVFPWHGIDEAEVRQRLEGERMRIKQEIYRQTQGDEMVPATDPLLDTGGVSTDPADDADALADNERTRILVSNSQAMVAQITCRSGAARCRHLRRLHQLRQGDRSASPGGAALRDPLHRLSGCGRSRRGA